MIDARIPFVTGQFAHEVGHEIKDLVKALSEALLGADSKITKNLGALFKALGVLEKVQALAMFYADTTVKVELDPAIYHQPEGTVKQAGATVTAGIDDAAWAAARQARKLSPFTTAAKGCARFLGLPVLTDDVDLGNTMQGWKVQWRLTRGGSRVQIPAGDQFTSGRLERTLTPASDHSGVDAIIYEVLPEKKENHPGDELTEPVEFCAEVFAKDPPGEGTVIGAGFAGVSLAGEAYAGLVAAVAKLLTAWVAAVQGAKGCGQATVSYHVPMPGTWKGTITVNTYVHTSDTSTEVEALGEPFGTTTTTSHDEQTIDVTGRYFVSGNDKDVGATQVPLAAQLFTSGVAWYSFDSVTKNAWTHGGCNYDKTEGSDIGGSWADNGKANVGITFSNDGSYWINISQYTPPDVTFVGVKVVKATVFTPDCDDNASGEFHDARFVAPNQAVTGGQRLEGKLDPANPGNRLKGSVDIVLGDGWLTTVSWDLVHETPIILPSHSVGG
jgi:hypothetical protein